MKYVAIKTVTTGGAPIIGCSVGPFENEIDAKDYAEGAAVGSLGYEHWLVQELQSPVQEIIDHNRFWRRHARTG
jgi:hypothetical protein